MTTLYMAVLHGYMPIIDWLRDRGADPNAPGPHGDTPLHLAISTDYTTDRRVVLALLSMGADVNAANEYGDTPLHRAAFHGRTDMVRLLLTNHADVTRRAQRGETALLYAARPEGHPETVATLLEGGADANTPDAFGMTALHGAAMIGDTEVARVLIERGYANVNRQTLAGYTPLHVAAEAGKDDFVRFLLAHGADRTVRDRDGLTPAERARQFPAMRSTKDGRAPVDTTAAIEALR
jgi:ankyrin repeat protein